ncbi:hypothetical protein M409DRAFT_59494 [Zasmidium cellare ATCC 36951]|uniref:Uncharacterized protein n=1 Tax=Zasmidium cellare ATCC 36951 TaxID=1080233 RepID=A0A6A6C464_ZASCE|nr:uncharacterized protein M409DRAFT_59494 [Zasmidium cellare ATCC 36951]KAF2160970.1 hypothetical protein M409DRAFT_59494 [Zasmidium cellare ATCC 36951]
MFSGVLTLLYLAVCVAAADGARYYGYGSGIKGLPLLYADGVAYIGNLPPPDTVVATNVTLSQGVSDGSFTASPTNQSVSSSGNWTSPKLVINNNSGAFAAAEFEANPNTTVTSTGFDNWGTMLVWISDSGDITTKWYADPVDDDLWVLKWNVDNTASDTATPVVLKSQAPIKK